MGKGKRILTVAVALLLVCAVLVSSAEESGVRDAAASGTSYIKWVDFGISAEALTDAMKLDIESYGSDAHLSWIDLLAALGTRYGGSFRSYRKADLLDAAAALRENPAAFDGKRYYAYYREAYGAVLSGMLGVYACYEKTGGGQYVYTETYGLKAFFPLARGYSYSDYDDFGAARDYGYRRTHLGHDLLGAVGTPVIAVESGYVEALGWNRFGGWRIGIRSFDGKRYYYYAHLRKDHPYNDLYEGKRVTAGEVIGYLGMTGYSTKENVNAINVPHLHFGLQLIFDPAQKDGANEIWIDVYALCRFLAQKKSAVFRNGAEYEAVNPITDFAAGE